MIFKDMITKPKGLNLKILLLLLVAGLILAGGYYVRRLRINNSHLQNLVNDTEALAKEETKSLVEKVGKLVVLPEGEDPVVATVTDKDKLKDQPVFAKAENGDKILIYPNARKAYIYNPQTNKIVDVVAVNIESQTPSVSGVSASAPLKIVLLNGSADDGLLGSAEKRIADQKNDGLQIVAKDTANKRDYTKTLVVDVTGKNGDAVNQLAQLLGGEVSSLPQGEIPPLADCLVIIGADFR